MGRILGRTQGAVVAAIGLVWLASAAPTPAAAEGIGFIAAANGDVSVQQGGAWQAAARDVEVEIGDAIRTGTGASAKIVLVDDTLLQIDEETELRIETWHVGDAATRDVSILRQARGRLRTTVGDAFGGSTNLEVHIPTAAIGIKGTDFEVVEGDLWEACLLSGGIRVSNAFGSASPRPGQCVYAYADRAPGDPHPNPREPLVVEQGGAAGQHSDRDLLEPIQRDVASPPGSEPGELPVNGDESPQIEIEDDLQGQPPVDIELDPPSPPPLDDIG